MEVKEEENEEKKKEEKKKQHKKEVIIIVDDDDEPPHVEVERPREDDAVRALLAIKEFDVCTRRYAVTTFSVSLGCTCCAFAWLEIQDIV